MTEDGASSSSESVSPSIHTPLSIQPRCIQASDLPRQKRTFRHHIMYHCHQKALQKRKTTARPHADTKPSVLAEWLVNCVLDSPGFSAVYGLAASPVLPGPVAGSGRVRIPDEYSAAQGEPDLSLNSSRMMGGMSGWGRFRSLPWLPMCQALSTTCNLIWGWLPAMGCLVIILSCPGDVKSAG